MVATAIFIGEESLVAQCAELWLSEGRHIALVISGNVDVADWASKKDIPVQAWNPHWNQAPALSSTSRPDWLFSIANLRILSDQLLAFPTKGAINFHDGPLPEFAGLNCPTWALLEGRTSHGVTWHFIEGGIDEGRIIAARTLPVEPGDTSQVLNARCYEAAIDSFGEVIKSLNADGKDAVPQDLSKRLRYYGRDIRPSLLVGNAASGEDIVRHIQALNFGPRYPNTLGLVRLANADSALVLIDAKFEPDETTSGASNFRVTKRDGKTIELAVPRGRMEVSKYVELGRPISVGATLTLSETEFHRASEFASAVAPHESFWRRTLMRVKPIELPATQAVGELEGVTRYRMRLRHGTAPADVISAIGVWLSRVTGELELNIGCQTESLKSALDGLPPLFEAYPPLVFTVDGAAPQPEVTRVIKGALTAHEAHSTFLRDLAERTPGTETAAPSVTVRTSASSAAAPQSSTLHFDIASDHVALSSPKGRLAAATLARFGAQIERVLRMPEQGDTPVELIDLLPEEERALLRSFSRTDESYHPVPIHQQFEDAVKTHPTATALAFENRTLSYRELNELATTIAIQLSKLAVGVPAPRVALLLPRSPELVASVLAVWKIGGSYIPVDPSYPEDRVALYIQDSEPAVVLVDDETKGRAPANVKALNVTALDRTPTNTAFESVQVAPTDLAYIIYTSGSTGKPKGVEIEHRGVANFFVGMDHVVPRRTTNVWLAVTSLSFDISVLELFYSLTRGFKVVMSGDESRALVSSGDAAKSESISFSLFYFASDEGERSREKYQLLLDGARFADEHGFEAVWTPERHFHAFGGLYPNPSVASAAIAAVTRNVKIRAGSCVIPLHHPIRIAEEWALVDNLSSGRVGISFAAGWQPNDFVFRPQNFAKAKETMMDEIETVRKLWRGETISFEGPKGLVPVRTLPRPVQPELPIWLTAAGNPETFRAAGQMGAGILTHLLGQSITEVEQKIQVYRQAWHAAGHPGDGHVTLMLHTFIGKSEEQVKEIVREPMKNYLRSSMNLIQQHAWSFPAFKKAASESASFEDNFTRLSHSDTEALLDHAFERYYETSGLFGTPQSALDLVNRCKSIGVTEIACLVDFGIDSQTVLASLSDLAQLKDNAAPVALSDEDWSLAAQIRRHQVTHLQTTPSLAKMLLTNPDSRTALKTLKHWFVGGEALSPALFSDIQSATTATVTNMYGPTETTVWSTTAQIESPEHISLGTPIANTIALVLDPRGNEVPVGVLGELCIGGHGVARGYHQRPELTGERFLNHPTFGRYYRTGDLARWEADGTLTFAGRLDHQVKLRGYRIELGEIESAIIASSNVSEAVVVLRADGGPERLVAYVVSGQGRPTFDHVRVAASLTKMLPPYMVPAQFVELQRFPLTPNKKVDRKALPVPPTQVAHSGEVAALESDIEEKIASVWRRILGIDSVGAHDNFFDLGGHSLLAVQAHREIKETTKLDLSITDIFRFPTIRTLAGHFSGDTDQAFATDVIARAQQRRDAMRDRRKR